MTRAATPILVVGAGPAGATAARTLALAGRPVRLLDRYAFPRNKPCGGGISFRTLYRFPYLERELPRIGTHVLSRLRLEGPGGESALIESDGPAALMIRRLEFDALLVSLAVSAGAELVTGAHIVQARRSEVGTRDLCGTTGAVTLVARDGRTFEADTVIAADGVHSIVARRLGLNPGWPASALALDMMEETPRGTLCDADPSVLWVSYGFSSRARQNGKASAPAEGYAYVFPKRDHVNVGIGYVLSYFRRAVRVPPYDVQCDLLDLLRCRGILTGESVRRNFTPFLIPVGGPMRRPGGHRVLLAGDAGGFVNAFTGEGIYYAMVSGDLAARAIIDADGAPGDELVKRYRSACRREMGQELRDSVLIQRYLFANPRRISRIVRNALRYPAATRSVLDYVRGARSYRSARRRLLMRSPRAVVGLLSELARSVWNGGMTNVE